MKAGFMKYIGVLLILGILISCTKNILFIEFKPIKNSTWKSGENTSFKINNTDTISIRNMFIHIRNTNEYELQSLFLITEIKFPKGKRIVDTLEYEMANEHGKWLGKKISSTIENKLFYKENVNLHELGDYTVTVTNATRGISDIEGVKSLKGIVDIGISIETIEP